MLGPTTGTLRSEKVPDPLLALFINDVYGQTGSEKKSACVPAGPAQITEGDNVIIGGSKKLPSQPCPLLRDRANLPAAFVQKPEIPAFPIAFDFRDLVVLGVKNMKTTPDRNELAPEVTEVATVTRNDPDFRANESTTAPDRNDGRLTLGFINVDGRGHLTFVDDKT